MRRRRLIEEALVDAYGDNEQHGAFLVILEDRVACPFTALVVGEEVDVRGFDWAGAPPDPSYAATSLPHRKVRPSLFHIKRDTTPARYRV